MNIFLKFISLLASLLSLYMVFIVGAFQINEGYNIFAPYIDTEFARNYSPDKFKQITSEYSREKVLEVLGPPLFDFYDSNTIEHEYHYTNDAYLKKSSVRTFTVNDFAWYRSSIRFDSNGKIIYIDKGWSFD